MKKAVQVRFAEGEAVELEIAEEAQVNHDQRRSRRESRPPEAKPLQKKPSG
jgi:hypothetical protein